MDNFDLRKYLAEGLFSKKPTDKDYESAMAIMSAIESIDTLTTNGHLDADASEKMVFEMGELYTAILTNASDETKAKFDFTDEIDDDAYELIQKTGEDYFKSNNKITNNG